MALSKKRRKRLLKKVEADLPKGHSLMGVFVRVNIRYPIEFILRNVGPWKMELRGHSIRMFSKRYRNFKEHGTACVVCGIRGRYFRLERNALQFGDRYNGFHLNLYAINGDGKEVLMTKDHIVPKSLGGSDNLANLQPMCYKCNGKKGNKEE